MTNETEAILFFSEHLHRDAKGLGTIWARHETSGAIIRANFVGGDVDGFPGIIRDGELVRPSHYHTYVRVGEKGAGMFQIIEDPTSRLERKRRSNRERSLCGAPLYTLLAFNAATGKVRPQGLRHRLLQHIRAALTLR